MMALLYLIGIVVIIILLFTGLSAIKTAASGIEHSIGDDVSRIRSTQQGIFSFSNLLTTERQTFNQLTSDLKQCMADILKYK